MARFLLPRTDYANIWMQWWKQFATLYDDDRCLRRKLIYYFRYIMFILCQFLCEPVFEEIVSVQCVAYLFLVWHICDPIISDIRIIRSSYCFFFTKKMRMVCSVYAAIQFEPIRRVFCKAWLRNFKYTDIGNLLGSSLNYSFGPRLVELAKT